MARTTRYHPDFDSDVLSSAEWYDGRNPTLGQDFVERVRLATTRIIEDPERRSPVEYGLRYWPVERFPYVVLYDVTASEVLLVGVMHTSQQPQKWIARRG